MDLNKLSNLQLQYIQECLINAKNKLDTSLKKNNKKSIDNEKTLG